MMTMLTPISNPQLNLCLLGATSPYGESYLHLPSGQFGHTVVSASSTVRPIWPNGDMNVDLPYGQNVRTESYPHLPCGQFGHTVVSAPFTVRPIWPNGDMDVYPS